MQGMGEPITGKAILLVDDDDDLAGALARMLEAEGYRVRRASDGDEGLRMATADPPDLIILDLLMPVKDGFAASAELRSVPALGRVPIIALTAFGQNIGETHGSVGREAGQYIQDVLEKPIEPNVLLQRVAAALAAVGTDGPASVAGPAASE